MARERGAYFVNGAKAIRASLVADWPILKRRLRTLQDTNHPSTADHAAIMALRARLVGIVDDEIAPHTEPEEIGHE
jgi:hypothetical protein